MSNCDLCDIAVWMGDPPKEPFMHTCKDCGKVTWILPEVIE